MPSEYVIRGLLRERFSPMLALTHTKNLTNSVGINESLVLRGG